MRVSRWLLTTCMVLALAFTGCQEKVSMPFEQGADQQAMLAGAGTVGLERAMAVQDRHSPGLLAISGVVGTATGLGADGSPMVVVLTRAPGLAGIPASLDGVPVKVKVTGEILALKKPSSPPGKEKPGKGEEVDPTGRFDRPVPVGVSTGNEGECSSGTIACRVTDGLNVYALSNNHVYALGNNAPLGSNVVQPGLYDTGCVSDPANVIGSLAGFVEIKFDGSGNQIDAAIALSTTGELGSATPSDGYGTPKTAAVPAAINQKVQKYGRTTGLTKGVVTLLNATVNVSYSTGTALFVDQIIVEARRPFIKSGDSGSLLVTDPGKDPVGLLFAANGNGKLGVANHIDPVLTGLGVTIDGE